MFKSKNVSRIKQDIRFVNQCSIQTSKIFSLFCSMVDEIINILRSNKENLFSKSPLQSMPVFGSYSSGNYNENSDVDILVELNGKMGFKLLRLNYEIEDLLKKKVDLISKRFLKQAFINEIEPELIYV